MGTGEQVVFASDGHGSDGIFHEVGVNFDLSVVQVTLHVGHAVAGILDGLTDSALREHLCGLLVEPGVEALEDIAGFALSEFEALLVVELEGAGFFFDVLQDFDEADGGFGPVCMVEDDFFEKVDPAKTADLLAKYA